MSSLVGFPRETYFLSFWQAILLSIVYVMFALWRLINTLNDDVGGNTLAAQLMLSVKARQVSLPTCLCYLRLVRYFRHL